MDGRTAELGPRSSEALPLITDFLKQLSDSPYHFHKYSIQL